MKTHKGHKKGRDNSTRKQNTRSKQIQKEMNTSKEARNDKRIPRHGQNQRTQQSKKEMKTRDKKK